MEKKKALIFILVGAIAVLFFIITRVYRPMLQINSELKTKYTEVKNKAMGLQKISEENVILIENKIKEASGELDKRIPPSGKTLNMIEQITGLGSSFNLSFNDISRLAPEEKEGYRVSSINISVKGTLYDFLRYLEEVGKGPLLISVENLSFKRGSESEPNLLSIIALFSGYQLTKSFPALPDLQEGFSPIEESRQARILEPILIPERSIDLSALKDAELFGSKVGIEPSPGGPKVVSPAEPEEKLELKLRGIAQEGDKRIALIDDKIVKEGDVISGAIVKEIGRFKVVLSKGARDYILEIGK